MELCKKTIYRDIKLWESRIYDFVDPQNELFVSCKHDKSGANWL